MRTWHTALTNGVRRHRRVLSAVFMLLIFGLLVWRLYRDWHSLPAGFLQSVDYPLLAGSLACLMGALLFVSSRWGMTLRALGTSISWRTSVRIWFLSQAGRYLPGGVWNYVGRFYLSQGEMGADTAILSMILETVLRILSEVLVFLLSFPFWPNRSFLDSQVLLLLAAGLVAGLCLLHPALMDRISRSSWLRRIGMEARMLPSLQYGTLLGLLVYYVTTVIAVGAAFYLLVRAIYPLPWQAFPALTGGFAASVVLGFLVPLAPGGWGVREGVMAFLLGQMMPSSVAIIISIASRLWLSLAEGIWILLILRLWRESY